MALRSGPQNRFVHGLGRYGNEVPACHSTGGRPYRSVLSDLRAERGYSCQGQTGRPGKTTFLYSVRYLLTAVDLRPSAGWSRLVKRLRVSLWDSSWT